MSEIRVRTRHQLLEAVLADVARTGRPLVTHIDEVTAEFGDVDAFLLAAQHRWYTAFYAHLDAVLEDPTDVQESVARMWWQLARQMPALRALLDVHTGRSILGVVEAQHRHRVLRDVGVDLATLPAAQVTQAARCPALSRWRRRHGLRWLSEVA